MNAYQPDARIPYAATAGGRRARNATALMPYVLAVDASPSASTAAVRWRKAVPGNVCLSCGINAPEVFDKAVFSSLVLTLRDEGLYQ